MKILFLIFSLFLSLFLVSSCTSKKPESQTTSTQAHQHDTQKEVWTCPMHPQIRKDQPGQCPICGMNLVKASQEEPKDEKSSNSQESTKPEGHASFSLSPQRQQMIGVKFGIAEKKPLFKTIRAAGRLAFDPELYTAQNEYVEALRQLERVKDSPLAEVRHSAERMVRSAKLRLKVLGLSDQQISKIGTSDGNSANLLIHKPGSQAWVYADVYEMDLPYVKAGQSVEMTASFLGGKTLVGKVASVDRVINPTTRTAKARILVDEATALLRPEAYVDVTIHSPLGEQVAVPFDAILDTGKQTWVFVADDKNQFIPQLVNVKFYAGDEVAIERGLEGGEKIVTSANFLIDSESRLKGVAVAQDAGGKPATPTCPSGQHWDDPMKMCMPN